MGATSKWVISTVLVGWAAGSVAAADTNHAKIRGTPSPDGSRILFVSWKDGDAEIYVARPDGSARVKLTDNQIADVRPEWSPDGKHILFVSDLSGTPQVHVMNSGGKNVRQLTREQKGVYLARYGPDGRIAYTAERDRYFKQRFYDLIILDGEAKTTIVRRTDVSDLAWRPDGKAIAYGGTGRLVFHDLVSHADTVVPFGKINKRLDANAVDAIRWRSDQKSITCHLTFVGGRTASLDGKGPRIFGDDEQFVITIDGKLSWSPRPTPR